MQYVWYEIIVARQITAFRCYPREGEGVDDGLAAFGDEGAGKKKRARCPLCSRGSRIHRELYEPAGNAIGTIFQLKYSAWWV